MKKYLLLLCILLSVVIQSNAQFGFGIVAGNDIYQRYTNPDGGSSGNAILNLQFGPKLWVGGESFSVSVETYANWGATSLSVVDYKGMGSIAFPLMAKLNFKGNSGFNSELTSGWSIGGGYQIARTELYGVNLSAIEQDVIRDLYPVMVGELSYGYGIGGFYVELFGRYGWDTQSKASTLNFGLSYNVNFVGFKKLKRKLERFDN
ncbi:hypothetical protein [Portibacter lacus]|uniref:Outer membrane protein beta-barrel domain-containing protein n=1 Tax=Portibacter lacus TaxID=1099794 RepID=A0AA37ST95_9BACT|nr:hypothetical protein [Portibacter lacus]GLR18366.1 hypothetical protein GCM10007940_29820 [Portibacter lacus]